MDPLAISLISFVCIFAGALSGYYLGNLLPDHHLSSESRDSVKMGWGIIATMSALVLSLLVASAKNTFDTVGNESIESAAKIIVLDQSLREYGPQADEVRSDLRTLVASVIKRDWPEVNIDSPVPAAAQHSNLMQAFHDEIRAKLKPTTDDQRESFSQADHTSRELALERWLVIEQSKVALPFPLFGALVFWLSMLFIGLGLLAPRNRTVLMMLVLCAVSVSIAIFLINDMSHPLKGLITVSSAPMLDVWVHINQP